MSIQASAAVQLENPKPEILRHTANFQRSIWGDRFLDYDSQDNITNGHMQQEVDELKLVVRRDIFSSSTTAGDDFSHNQLKLIDAIQRLGLSYHFEREIEEALESIHAAFPAYQDDDDLDLFNDSLGFRLLRHHGYNVSCDIFSKFQDTNGSFKECLTADVSGMLSFYEAAHLRVHGETILDEALVFTTTHLESWAKTHVSSPLATQITQALDRPLLKSPERLSARRFMSIYGQDTSASHNESLLKLAKLDFNLVQALHKKEHSELASCELMNIARLIWWWKELDFQTKLPFVRDRLVETYLWAVAAYFEPQYSMARIILTKVCVLLTDLDDIYDAFGTYEELKVFTEAIERWDISCMDGLPGCMQVYYKAFLNLYNEIEEQMLNEGRSYAIYYVKEQMKRQARAYFVEAGWLHEGRVPSMEEYMPVATVSINYLFVEMASFLGMGDLTTNETFEWVFNRPKIVQASCIIFRLMDDIVSTKFEKEREHSPSSVDCYMKQYSVSEQETIDVFNKQIVDSWKDINEEFLKPAAQPRQVLMRVLNLARIVDLFYKGEDGFTIVGKLMEDSVTALFINPVPL